MACATHPSDLTQKLNDLLMDMITKNPETAKEAHDLFLYMEENVLKPLVERTFESIVNTLPAAEAEVAKLLRNGGANWFCIPKLKKAPLTRS
jgi:hypothetical protein